MQRSPWWGVPPERRAPSSGWQDKVWHWLRRWVASRIQPAGDQQPQDAADASAEAIDEAIRTRLRPPR